MAGGEHAHHGGHASMIADFRRRFWVSLVLTVPILLLSGQIQQWLGLGRALEFPGSGYVLFVLSSFVFFYGGWPFLKGIYDELKSRRPGMMTLIAMAITTAYVYSSATVFGLRGMDFFWELATLVDIMLLGHWIEMRSVMGASRALEELARLMPSDAHKLMPDGEVRDVPLGELVTGDRVLVKPGEKVPADGLVAAGESAVNEAMLTGESAPVDKKPGAKVIGGAINGEGALTVEVSKTGKDSFLSQVVELVRQAQESKSRTQDIANRAAVWLTVVALAGGTASLIVWLALGRGFAFSLERAVTVMVITCPHALGLAVPLVVAISTAISARNGLLIRNRAAFERARNIQAIVFDKTGTLTQGKFGVTDTIVLGGLDEPTLLQYAAAVEANSEHPIAKGITAATQTRLPAESFRAIPGRGAEAHVSGHDVKVVSPGYMREHEVAADDPRLAQLAAQGKTVVMVMVDGELQGAIALADIVRPESKTAIQRLKAMGIRSMMLTGDNPQVARSVAEAVGLDEYFAEVLPQDKAAKIKEVQARGLVVAMTGDGVNDAPALAQADVGIAIGAGTDVAIETADIILVRSNPLDVVAIVGLARATYRKMVQNLVWATGYNVIAIPLAAGVLYSWGVVLTPAAGAVLMSVSTVIVAINARLLRLRREPQP
jgi:Cu2+-exporting ATPase